MRGVTRLRGARYRICPDRIEAGTFLIAGAITGGQPVIQQTEENQNPLGPVQAIGSKFTGISF